MECVKKLMGFSIGKLLTFLLTLSLREDDICYYCVKPRLTLHGFRIKSLSIERITRDENLGPPAEVKHTQASLIIALGKGDEI